MRLIIQTFIMLSALGLFLSAIVHVSSLLGFIPFGESSWVLHVGAIIVWFPAVISVMSNYKEYLKLDWKEALLLNSFKQRLFKGCPKWMILLTALLFVYGILNFALFILSEQNTAAESVDEANTLRGFSGHWMVFYSAALSLLYAAKERLNDKKIKQLT